MRELLLHVGMHKTGTTSIQQTLHAHVPLLQDHGYSWFDAGDANHSGAVYSAFTDKPHLYHENRRRGLHQPEDGARRAAACRAQLADFLTRASGPRMILSGEDISALRKDGVDRMLAAFRPLVDRIIVIGFVRPPRSYVESAIQQRIKGGETLAGLHRRPVTPRYRERFAPFLSAPEVYQVLLHPFTPETLEQGCSVATFLRLIGAPESLYPRISVVRSNTGGSHLARVLALAANEAVPVFGPDGGPNPGRAARLTRFLDGLPGPRFEVPAEFVAASLAACGDDIAWMEGQLGAPFAAAQKTTHEAGVGSAIRPLGMDELRALVAALNSLIMDPRAARLAGRVDPPGVASERPAPSPAPDGQSDPPAAERLARRAERRHLRQRQT